MSNVLITTLTDSLLNNDGFQKLDTIVFNVTKAVNKPNITYRTIIIRTNAAVQVTIKGGSDAYFVDANDENAGLVLDFPSSPDNDLSIRWSNADAQIIIGNKSNITQFKNANSAIITLDLEQFNFTRRLSYLTLSGTASTYIGFNTIDLRNSPNLATIFFNSVKEEIDFDYFPIRNYSFIFYNIRNSNSISVSKLAKLKTATQIEMTGASGIIFNLEDVLVGMLNNGRTNNLLVLGTSNIFKFNNTLLSFTLKIEFGEGTITVKKNSDSSIIATYSDGTWSYT